jgi:DNA primase
VVAFGGRLLGDGEPKYLNSPQTPLFHKGRLLYGLALARQAAAEAGEVIVVEGYMDVIALARVGSVNAVAPLGTALTEQQLAELWRLAPEPVLCLDGDAAGARAAARAALLALPLLKPDLSLRIAALPAGQDPDALVGLEGPQGLRGVIAAARPLATYLWELERARRPLDTPERRAGFKARLMDHVRRIRDSEVQRAYRGELERRFAAAFDAAPEAGRRRRADWRSDKRPGLRRDGGFGARTGPEALRLRAYQGVLAALLNHPALLLDVDEELATVKLPGPALERLRQAMLAAMAHDPDLDREALRGHLSQKGFSGLLDTLLSNAVYVHARFARPDQTDEVAREGVRYVIALLREQDARSENVAAERAHAEHMTDASLGDLEASRKAVRESEALNVDLDRYEAMVRGKPK